MTLDERTWMNTPFYFWMALIRQPPKWLVLEKDQEVERQVADLVQRSMVEPEGEAWSLPIVLVHKKNNSGRLCTDYCQLKAVTRKNADPFLELTTV